MTGRAARRERPPPGRSTGRTDGGRNRGSGSKAPSNAPGRRAAGTRTRGPGRRAATRAAPARTPAGRGRSGRPPDRRGPAPHGGTPFARRVAPAGSGGWGGCRASPVRPGPRLPPPVRPHSGSPGRRPAHAQRRRDPWDQAPRWVGVVRSAPCDTFGGRSAPAVKGTGSSRARQVAPEERWLPGPGCPRRPVPGRRTVRPRPNGAPASVGRPRRASGAQPGGGVGRQLAVVHRAAGQQKRVRGGQGCRAR